ncbi:MAG: hypothetical protein N2Z76_06120 [Treponemataceae bacterium]|nr:hypothetical protein [Treponemataceae bacterium]
MIKQLSSLSSLENVLLVVNRTLENVVASYKGKKSFHDMTGMPFQDILAELRDFFKNFKTVTLIDINAFFLEYNIREHQRNDFLYFLEEIHNSGIIVSIVDYFGTCTLSEEEYTKRLYAARERIKSKIQGILVTTRIGYYLRKFIPERMEIQLIPPLKGPLIIRPIPLNREEVWNNRVIGYKNLLGIVPRKREKKNRKTVFVGLSRFFEYTVEHLIIRNLCKGIFFKLKEVLDIERIVCIDPFSCIEGIDLPKGMRLETYKWLEAGNLEQILEEALFAGLFIPYGTVGTLALNCGVPFVSFYASTSSVLSDNFRSLMNGQLFPGFYGLGIWEDEIYFPDLAYSNPYFNSVSFCDICDSHAFINLANDFKNGIAEERVQHYQNWVTTLNTPLFSSCFDYISHLSYKAKIGGNC